MVDKAQNFFPLAFPDSRDLYLMFQDLNILNKKTVCVVPGQEDILQYIPYSFLLKSQIFCPYHRRIDKV